MDLNGKTIVLTGAGSGIGRALLAALCAFDVRMLAADVNGKALREAVAALPHPEKVHSFTGDLGNPAAIDALFGVADDVLGTIDVFIANAGFAYYEPFDGRWEHIEAIYRVNVFSPLYALDLMTARHPLETPFTFVMTVSAMAQAGLAGYALYSSTKAALDRFAGTYRLEAPAHARLMLVYPIATRSQFFANGGRAAPTPWPNQPPEKVAEAIVRGLQRDRRSVHPSRLYAAISVIGRVVPILRLYQRGSQVAFRRWLARQDQDAL